MFYVSRFSVLTGILALSPFWVCAQSAETIADIRCIVIGIKATEQNNSSQQSAGAMLTLYFIGRLEGRISEPALENLLFNEIQKMTSAEYAAEAKRCAASLEATGQQITRIGKIISNRGQ